MRFAPAATWIANSGQLDRSQIDRSRAGVRALPLDRAACGRPADEDAGDGGMRLRSHWRGRFISKRGRLRVSSVDGA
jgi:hypothetical protein